MNGYEDQLSYRGKVWHVSNAGKARTVFGSVPSHCRNTCKNCAEARGIAVVPGRRMWPP